MIIRNRNNLNMLRKKRLFKNQRDYFEVKREYYRAIPGNLDFKTASKEQLAAIRKQVIRNRKNRNMGVAAAMLIVAVFGVYVAFTVMHSSGNEPALTEEQQSTIQKDYLLYLEDGDSWLRKNHWHNAIFQYKKALEVYPNDFDAQHRLALAYTYRCQSEATDCYRAQALIDRLINQQPENPILHELRASYHEIQGELHEALADYEQLDQLTTNSQ